MVAQNKQPFSQRLLRCQNFVSPKFVSGRSAAQAGLLVCGAVSMVLMGGAKCQADTVTLRTGALVRGRVLDATGALGHRPTTKAEREQAARLVGVFTLTGGRLILDSAEVSTIAKRPLVIEEFEVRKRHTANDVDSQWRLAEWCKSRGLRPQREETLRQVLALDPDNLQAHQGLGQTKRDGQWRTYDEEMRARGFVKFENRYVAQQEVEILKKLHQRKRADQDWVERVRGAMRSLASNDPEKRRRGNETLLKISDAEAIPALNKILLSSANDDTRELYIHIVAGIKDDKATAHLVDLSLFDPSKPVRVAAQEAVMRRPRTTAAGLYARHLRDADNEIVRRCGLMLEKVGDASVISSLIDALVTTHGVPTQVVDNSNSYNFNRNGLPPNTVPLPPDVYAKLATGQYPNGVQVVGPPGVMMPGPTPKTVMVDHEYRNAEVLSALQALTRQSFGFDKEAWQHWWSVRQAAGPFKTSSTQ
jgi:hypothetical protein